MDYFAFKSPPIQKLKSDGYKFPPRCYPSREAIQLIDDMLLSAHNKDRALYIKLKAAQKHISTAVTKPAVLYYAYYRDYPQRFNHDPINIIGHMMFAIHHSVLALCKFNKIDVGQDYLVMDVKLLRKYKDRVISTLAKDSRRVSQFRHFSRIDYLSIPSL